MKLNKLYSILVEVDGNGIPQNIPSARYGKWGINSLGFRGKEIDMEKKEGQIRILCFGVSETFGFYESKDKEWPSQLGEILGDKFPRVEVINVSEGEYLLWALYEKCTRYRFYTPWRIYP